MSSCYYPIKAYRTADENGRIMPTLSFKSTEVQVISELLLPCGRCIGCRLNHAESWAVRMVHEAQMHDQNAFITLTYDQQNLPENGNLRYEDVTLFIKKLRKWLSSADIKFKYYYVGEYGENFSRPHYHLVLFGFDFSQKLRYRGIENERYLWRNKNGNNYYRSTVLEEMWNYGHCELGEVNYKSCMYVAGYVTKKITGELALDHYSGVNPISGEMFTRVREQARMSRRPAIGREWLAKFQGDIYPRDEVIIEARRLKVPRYYDKYLESTNPELLSQIKQVREENATVYDNVEANREHGVKIKNLKFFQGELTGQLTPNSWDSKAYAYKRDEITCLHFQERSR